MCDGHFTSRSVLFLSVYIYLSVCLLVVHAWTNKRVHIAYVDNCTKPSLQGAGQTTLGVL